MENGTMEIAQKALKARARYEAMKVEFTIANKALEKAKLAMWLTMARKRSIWCATLSLIWY